MVHGRTTIYVYVFIEVTKYTGKTVSHGARHPPAHKTVSDAARYPPPIFLKDWIDRRIGGEIETRKGAKGQFEIWIRGAPLSATAPKSAGPKARVPEPAEKMTTLENFLSK